MSILGKEAENIQNAGLGAALLWRFTIGYAAGSGINQPSPLPLIFLPLPIAFHEETAAFLKSTHKASGLRAFADKFGV